MLTNSSPFSKPTNGGRYEFNRYEPQADWYAHRSWSGVHAEGHAARVLIWADQIARHLIGEGQKVNLEAVRWAAVLHDVRRYSDGGDFEHGERAAVWLKEQAPHLPTGLDEAGLECCCYCCWWHVPGDAAAPAMTPELTCLKDADGLDRVRLYDLNVKYLRTPFARTLVGQAERLYKQSWRLRDIGDWAAVRMAALELGLWR